MKSLSFIFNSETLEFKCRLPAGAVLAIVIVVLANLWVFDAQKSGILYTSVPRQMVEESIEELVLASGTWWLGNSTMASGLDKAMVDRELGNRNAYVELGSATLDVQVRLATTALSQRESGPERIVLFVTKDDLNAGGSRATASSLYMQAFESPGLYEIIASYFPVYSCRYAIVDKLRDGLAGMLPGKNADRPAAIEKKNEQKKITDLDNEIDSTYLRNLGQNFRELDVDFNGLSEQARRTGTEVLLVAPPVTRSISAWQARYVPDYPWERLLKRLADRASESGIRMYDYSGLLESTTEYFKDVYHLNFRGALKFTRSLLEDTGIRTSLPAAAAN